MNLPDEIAVEGWAAIALTLGMSVRSAYRRKGELKAAGVIFYRKKGWPPRRFVYHFPSRLKQWTGIKTSIGENI